MSSKETTLLDERRRNEILLLASMPVDDAFKHWSQIKNKALKDVLKSYMRGLMGGSAGMCLK
jgi:hypothetical protein